MDSQRDEWLDRRLQRGDEIVSVDGVPVDENNIVAAVKGTDVVGSHVRMRVRKMDGKMVEAKLVRGAWGAVERKERSPAPPSSTPAPPRTCRDFI